MGAKVIATTSSDQKKQKLLQLGADHVINYRDEAHLSDRLQGQGGFSKAWPTDDAGTSRAERREIQQFLLNKGYAIGAADGLIGDKTRQAIRQEQNRLGLSPTGRAGQQILRAFRNENAQKMMK